MLNEKYSINVTVIIMPKFNVGLISSMQAVSLYRKHLVGPYNAGSSARQMLTQAPESDLPSYSSAKFWLTVVWFTDYSVCLDVEKLSLG
jgi:hypothetical protein